MSLTLSREELAWAAGFFDGEGHISCTPNNGGTSRRVRIAIGQVDRRPLERFNSAVGGLGHILEKPSTASRKPTAQPIWMYYAARYEHAQAIIAMLWPFLCEPKQEQAHRALAELQDFRRK